MSERAQQSHVYQEQDTQQSSSQAASKIQPLEIVEKNNNDVSTSEAPIQPSQPITIISDELQVQTTIPRQNQPASINPVRVLFQHQDQEHHQQEQEQEQEPQPNPQQEGQQQTISCRLSDSDDYARTRPDEPSIQASVSTSVIDLNRQLIERQLEAMQAADSQRWNFDFRLNRPLGIEGHRYQVVQFPRPNRRTLSEQNIHQTNTGTRFNQQQHQQAQQHQHQQRHQWRRLSTDQGSDCNRTHRDKPDHKQDDAQQ